MSETVAVVDYGMGNLHSVRHALGMVGAEVIVTRDPGELRSAARIVLPGVGAFGECVKTLRASGMLATLEDEVLRRGKPMLGICLGMQILATSSEEMGMHQGLDWIPGRVRRLGGDLPVKGLRIPHVGWNEVVVGSSTHPVLRGLKQGTTFYFVHSYVVDPDDSRHSIATCDYGGEFTCAVARDNLVATQFHPEKSQQAGLALLDAFLAWKP